MPPETTEQLRQAFRSQMPVTRRLAYFDHAAVAPLPQPTREAMGRWLDQACELGDTVWPDWARAVERARATAAGMLGASEDNVALVPSTTAGITLVAEGIDWRTGDNVVTLADEFPSNLYPWLHQQDRGVEVRRLPTDNGRVDPAALRAACDQRTRVVSVSWVGYLTGYRQPIDLIAQIAHDAGALFFLDAIQGLGVLPLDVKESGVDCLAADGHKWMLGPEGAGLAYLSDECLRQLRPIGVGWNSVADRFDFTRIDYKLRKTAARYEGGSANMVGMIGLGASLDLLSSFPARLLPRAIVEITDYACQRLHEIGAVIASHREVSPEGHDPRTGIVSFELPGQDPVALRQRCLDEQIVLSCRGGRLRIAAHGYNTTEDVDRLIDVLSGA